MATRGLGEKSTKKSSATERSGRHGIHVPGLDAPETPYRYESLPVKSAVSAELRKMPSYSEDPFALNPSLKGFKQAKPWRGSSHFPVKGINKAKD